MKIIKVKKENKGYNVTLGDKTSHSIPYIKGTFLYKETKAYIDGGGVIEEEFSSNDLALQKLNSIQTQTQEKINNLTKNYTSFEKDTFTTQETEARAWKADNTELTPFLDALCEARGVKKTIMIEKIISNADALKAPVAKIIGEYQKAIT